MNKSYYRLCLDIDNPLSKVSKIYKAVVWGKTDKSGEISVKILRDRFNRTKFNTYLFRKIFFNKNK